MHLFPKVEGVGGWGVGVKLLDVFLVIRHYRVKLKLCDCVMQGD